MLRFTFAYVVCATIWVAFVHREAFGAVVLIYLLIAAPWGLYLAATREAPREVIKEVPVPVPAPAPAYVPFVCPTTGEKAQAAKRKYDEALQMLERAWLDGTELGSAKAKAKQQYLKDLDEAMK